MKKFTSLFALLSCLCVVSAQADGFYVPKINENEHCVIFESMIQNDNDQCNIYSFDAQGTELTGSWPGNAMTRVGVTSNNKRVFKYTFSSTLPKIIVFSYNGYTKTKDLTFEDGGYYNHEGGENGEGYGKLDHIVADGSTVYFYNSESWGNVRIFAFDSNKNAYEISWPGQNMEFVANNLYKFHIDECSFNNIVFNNGDTGGANQTADLTAENNKVYVIDGTTNNEGSHYTFTADASLTITDGVNFPYNKDFAVLDANYTRTNVTSEWGTLCLPFGFNVSDQQNVTFYSLSAVNPETRSINFSPINNGQVSPGQAVLFKLSSGSLSITANNGVTVTSNPLSGESVGLYGTFVETHKDNVYYISVNQFYFGSNILIKPYRGIVENAQGPSEQSGGAPFRFTVDDTEDIQFVEQEDGTVKAYYDLQGRKLDGARKGLVIENGKIIMVK